ncbi:MAG: GreA/GreB family elongation factor [Kiritimatiellae bacterium]|nr:GreA/GreB family elongation factor [Kiritimatiellia bacterium]
MDKTEFEGKMQELLKAEPLNIEAVTALIRDRLADDVKGAVRAFSVLTEVVVDQKNLANAVACIKFYSEHAEQLRDITLNQMREVIRRSATTAEDKLLVDSIGLNTAIASAIVRRLSVLLALKPGVYVNSQSWGFGQVQQIDTFYSKVIIDFSGKKGHAMSLSVAGQNLSVADDNHLMTRYMKDPESIKTMVEKHPGEVVRLTIQSYGEMSVIRLAERLAETGLVPQANWKKFWESARRSLKADKVNPVEIPTKRTDPIRLLDAEEDFGDKWLARYARQKDIKAIYDSTIALMAAKKDELPDGYRKTVGERLAFALKGAERTDYPRYAQLAVLMRDLKLSSEEAQVAQADLLLEEDETENLLCAMRGLSARDVTALAGFLLAVKPESKGILLDYLPQYNSVSLSAVLSVLANDEATGNAVRSILARQANVVPTMVVWALRNCNSNTTWQLPSLNELVTTAIYIIEQRHTGENLKMRNTLQAFFDSARWLEELCKQLTAFDRQVIFERIQASTAWETTSQRNILVRMAHNDPALAKFRRQVKTQTEQEHITSLRSYTAMQLAYDHLINVEIPANTRDIATARSYGDLRENAEYQFAKDHQRVLLSRQDEMARRLKALKVADFSNVSTDTVVPGTRVTLKTDKGELVYTILGELDSDETLNIISCRTRLAAALLGKRTGDAVELPAEKGVLRATVTGISVMDDAVRAWLAAIPTAHVVANA